MYTLLMITNRDVRDGGGASYRIVNLAKYISERGFRVIIVDSRRNVYIEAINGQLNEKKMPNSFFISLFYPIPTIVNGLLTLALRFPKEEVGRISSLFNFSLFLNALRIALRVRPHIIQVEEYFSLVPLALILKKIVNSRLLILDEHNIETHRLMRDPRHQRHIIRAFRDLEHLACKLSDCVFVVSKLDFYRLRKVVGYNGKIEIIPNFVDIKEVEKQIRKNNSMIEGSLKISRPALIFHGDFRYFPNREAISIFISKILPYVKKLYPNLVFIVAGPGSPRIIRSDVIFLGYVKNLYSLLNICDVAVVPLLRGGGTRIKVLEYIACGVPVVSTAVGVEGLDLENNKDVIIADIDSFADSIIRLLKDMNLKKLLVINAVRKVREIYTAEKVAEKVTSIYLKLLKYRYEASDLDKCSGS